MTIPFDWIAMISVLLGSFLLARRKRLGWIPRLVGDGAWMGWSLTLGIIYSFPLFAMNAVFLLVDGYGFWNWRKNRT